MRRTSAVLTVCCLALALGAAACSNSPEDFGNRIEGFLEGADFRQQVKDFSTADLTFSDATCAKPENTDPGTTFECSVTGSDGQVYDLTVEVRDNSSADVIAMEPVPTP